MLEDDFIYFFEMFRKLDQLPKALHNAASLNSADLQIALMTKKSWNSCLALKLVIALIKTYTALKSFINTDKKNLLSTEALG